MREKDYNRVRQCPYYLCSVKILFGMTVYGNKFVFCEKRIQFEFSGLKIFLNCSLYLQPFKSKFHRSFLKLHELCSFMLLFVPATDWNFFITQNREPLVLRLPPQAALLFFWLLPVTNFL